MLDGEIVVRQGAEGHERLDWEALSQRIHPAESRILRLSQETPADFVAFDLLYLDGRSIKDEPFEVRRAALELLFESLDAPLHITQTTRDSAVARTWLTEFEGAGLDGVVSKPLADPYAPGKRTMLKTKHVRTADAVVIGYRIHKSGSGVGSLLLGLYDDDGELRGVGGISAFSNARRESLIDELDHAVLRDDSGAPVAGESERSRFSGTKDMSFVTLRPELVVEVRYDQLEGSRFRHTVQFERWRPDREARSCTLGQLERPRGLRPGNRVRLTQARTKPSGPWRAERAAAPPASSDSREGTEAPRARFRGRAPTTRAACRYVPDRQRSAARGRRWPRVAQAQ